MGICATCSGAGRARSEELPDAPSPPIGRRPPDLGRGQRARSVLTFDDRQKLRTARVTAGSSGISPSVVRSPPTYSCNSFFKCKTLTRDLPERG